MQTIFGIKQKQSQVFLEDGTRVPVTVVSVPELVVTQLKNEEKDGYSAIQLGVGTSRKQKKSVSGLVKKANLKNSPRVLREVRISKDEDVSALTPGAAIALSEVLQPGDIVLATGVSKGKGFAGGVKRFGFAGGPKTHGQSDRHRAPGSIGQGTTPGRVYKGKRMAGHMGQTQVTVRNLIVVDIQGSDIYVSGLIPGSKNTLVRLQKIGEKKNFVPVFTVKTDEPKEASEEQVTQTPVEEPVKEETDTTAPETASQETGGVEAQEKVLEGTNEIKKTEGEKPTEEKENTAGQAMLNESVSEEVKEEKDATK